MKRWPLALLARISTRLLAFNLLLVFLPVAAFLALDTYERQLLRALEHALVQQARVLASALSGHGALDAVEAQRILRQLARRQEARLRVVDSAGTLLADSSRGAPPEAQAASRGEDAEPSERALYSLASFPVRLYRRTLRPPQPPLESSEFYGGATVLAGAEIREALEGRYGAATRISSGGQVSVTLYSAIPVWSGSGEERDPEGRRVAGAVLASQSSYRILRDLYELRLQVFRIFLGSIGAAVAISLLVSTTITGPLRRLQGRARMILDHRGRIAGHFQATGRSDEIGDLSRALQELTHKQEQHLRVLESFAADLSHELKNPLAAIRSAAEMALQAADGGDRRRFLEMIRRDTARMERLLTEVREISRVDAHMLDEERSAVDVGHLAADVLDVMRMRGEADGLVYRLHAEQQAVVRASADRLVQVLEKLLENAASFSPAGETIDVSVLPLAGQVLIRVEDRGPGVSEPLRARIFDRFFTYRPAAAAAADSAHSGLGLSLVRTIVQGYGGSVCVAAREGGGASFEVRLPAGTVAVDARG